MVSSDDRFWGAGLDEGLAVALSADGKVIVAGVTGTPDTTFGGGDGVVITNFGGTRTDQGLAVKLQADGKALMAG